MKRDVVIIGASILDVLALPTSEKVFETGSYTCKDIALSFGGDALNEAIILSKMKKKVELITLLGNDQAGQMIERKCQELDIHLINEKKDELKTGINVVLVKEDGSRHFLTSETGTLRKLTINNIPLPFNSDAKVLCFASIFVFPYITDHELFQLFTQAKKQNMIVVADMTKCKNHETINDLKQSLPLVDYLIPNDEEALLFTQSSTVEEACSKLLEVGVKNVIVKCGSKGCYVSNCTENYWQATKKVDCLDTTGAGDSFVSGFVNALLDGKNIQECVQFANYCGGQCVQVIGATQWL